MSVIRFRMINLEPAIEHNFSGNAFIVVLACVLVVLCKLCQLNLMGTHFILVYNRSALFRSKNRFRTFCNYIMSKYCIKSCDKFKQT